MTAASVIARAFAISVPLPFLYAAFPVETVAFWLTVVTFQSVVGAFSGIVPTLAIQMIAYAYSGSSSVSGSMADHERERIDGPNWPLIAEVNRVIFLVFVVISATWILFSASLGSLVVWRPMLASGMVADSAWAWAIFIVGAALRLLAQPYAAFGQGVGAIAPVRRQEALSWLIGGAGAVVVLALLPSLPLAMLAIQAPILLNYVQYRRLARRLGWQTTSVRSGSPVFRDVWSRGWRGGVGQMAAIMTIYGSGFIYAQAGSGAETAGYLFGLNILGIVGQIAISPIYAAIPALAAHYASGRKDEMNREAQRVIGRSMGIFVVLALAAPLIIVAANVMLPEPLAFPGGHLWLAMCVSAMATRHGGNHLQYFTTTNDVRWHQINSIFLVLSLGPFLFLPTANALLLVVVQGAATALFYLPYARLLTFREFGYGLRRDLRDFALPLTIMVAGLSGWWALEPVVLSYVTFRLTG